MEIYINLSFIKKSLNYVHVHDTIRYHSVPCYTMQWIFTSHHVCTVEKPSGHRKGNHIIEM